MRPASRRKLRIGILGGSISVGVGVPPEESYGAVLERSPSLVVLNRAVRATGVAHASFCVDTLMPESVDVLIIEFAVNDGWYGWHGIQSTGGIPV